MSPMLPLLGVNDVTRILTYFRDHVVMQNVKPKTPAPTNVELCLTLANTGIYFKWFLNMIAFAHTNTSRNIELVNNLLREAKKSIIDIIELVDRLDVIKCFVYFGTVNAYSGQWDRAKFYFYYVKEYLDKHDHSDETVVIESIYYAFLAYVEPNINLMMFFVYGGNISSMVFHYDKNDVYDLSSIDDLCAKYFKFIDESDATESDRAFKKQNVYLAKLGAQLYYLSSIELESSPVAIELANQVNALLIDFAYPLVSYMSHTIKVATSVHAKALASTKSAAMVSLLKHDVRLLKQVEPSFGMHGSFISEMDQVIQHNDQLLNSVNFIYFAVAKRNEQTLSTRT
jgi:hypothetical protein